jgi:hypothetical protein
LHVVKPVQFAHVPPSAPQAFFAEPTWQVPLPAQHPLQLEPSHTQAPPMQCSPLPQGLAVPQPQVPVVRQVSAFTGSHTVQAPPARPHAVAVRS